MHINTRINAHEPIPPIPLCPSIPFPFPVPSPHSPSLSPSSHPSRRYQLTAPPLSPPGSFGLWKWCTTNMGGELECTGKLDDFDSLLSTSFKAATILVGLSVVITLLCICCMLLFFFCSSATVFHVSGCLQLLSGGSCPQGRPLGVGWE